MPLVLEKSEDGIAVTDASERECAIWGRNAIVMVLARRGRIAVRPPPPVVMHDRCCCRCCFCGVRCRDRRVTTDVIVSVEQLQLPRI